jgi:hypothetical protein
VQRSVRTLLKVVMQLWWPTRTWADGSGRTVELRRVDDMLSALWFSSRPELGRLPTVLLLSALRKEGSITEFIGFFVVAFISVLATHLLFNSGLISFIAPAPGVHRKPSITKWRFVTLMATACVVGKRQD